METLFFIQYFTRIKLILKRFLLFKTLSKLNGISELYIIHVDHILILHNKFKFKA